MSAAARRTGMAIAVLATAVYAALGFALDPGQMQEGLRRLGAGGAALVLGLSLLNYVLRFLRWHWYVGHLGKAPPLLHHGLIYLAGFALTVSPGKAGEAVRALYLQPLGVGYARSLATLLVERLLDLLAIGLLSALLLAAIPALAPGVAVLAIGAVGAAIVTGTSWPVRALQRLAAGNLPPRLRAAAARMAQLMAACADVLQARLLLPGLLVGVLAWGAEGLGLYLLLESMGTPIAASSAVGIYALAALAGAAVIVVPGGLGGTEAAMTALLVLFGVPLPVALTATLLCRLATLWFAVVLGLTAVAALELARSPAPAPTRP